LPTGDKLLPFDALQPPSIVTIAPFIVLLISLDKKSSRFAISHNLDVSFLDGCKATTVLDLLAFSGIIGIDAL